MKGTSIHEETEVSIDGLKSLVKGVLIGAMLCVLASLGTSVGVVVIETRQDDIEERERIGRSIEFCKDENRNTERRRNLERDRVAEYAVDFFGSTPEEAEALVPSSPEFEAFIVSYLPFRTCTEQCVEQDRDPLQEDCPPADNIEGDATR